LGVINIPHSEQDGASSIVARWRVDISGSAYFAAITGALGDGFIAASGDAGATCSVVTVASPSR
jgi:hypothetical protein